MIFILSKEKQEIRVQIRVKDPQSQKYVKDWQTAHTLNKHMNNLLKLYCASPEMRHIVDNLNDKYKDIQLESLQAILTDNSLYEALGLSEYSNAIEYRNDQKVISKDVNKTVVKEKAKESSSVVEEDIMFDFGNSAESINSEIAKKKNSTEMEKDSDDADDLDAGDDFLNFFANPI